MKDRRWKEEVIVAQWLRGENLADIDAVKSKDFQFYPKIVGYIKQYGVDKFKTDMVSEKLMTPKEYAEVYDKNFPSLYSTFFKELLTASAQEWVREHPNASPEELIKQAQAVTDYTSELPSSLKEPALALIEEFESRSKEKLVMTGLRQLDNLLWGVRPGELTFVGARPSVGKSAFLLQIAEEVAKQGKKVMYLSLEMSELTMWTRVLLRHVPLSQESLRRGLKEEDWANPELTNALEYINNMKNFMLIPNARELRVIKELVETHKPYMLVVDQLQQMNDNRQYFKDVRSRFSHMTRELQNLALEENIAVWCACQINRSADDSVPTMANLKEAGNIEEDATNVILLHREGEKTERQLIRCELAKQKEGACGDFQLSFHAPTFTFNGTQYV